MAQKTKTVGKMKTLGRLNLTTGLLTAVILTSFHLISVAAEQDEKKWKYYSDKECQKLTHDDYLEARNNFYPEGKLRTGCSYLRCPLNAATYDYVGGETAGCGAKFCKCFRGLFWLLPITLGGFQRRYKHYVGSHQMSCGCKKDRNHVSNYTSASCPRRQSSRVFNPTRRRN